MFINKTVLIFRNICNSSNFFLRKCYRHVIEYLKITKLCTNKNITKKIMYNKLLRKLHTNKKVSIVYFHVVIFLQIASHELF